MTPPRTEEELRAMLAEDCPECGGWGCVSRIEPDCCGLAGDLGYCRGDCAVPREVQDQCPSCGGSGRSTLTPKD